MWPYWQQRNEESTAIINHQPWQELINQYLTINGQHHLFAYRSVTVQDNLKLDNYLKSLSQLDPRQYSQAVQYAYWVNLYNALTVNLILEEYPVGSITKLGGLFSFGPWETEVISINGQSLTLNDIEHRILRPIWQDPRTHYALNCASLGCPNLQITAFSALNSDALLEQAAHEFINSDKGVKVEGQNLVVSSIYDWFSEDFVIDGSVKQHLKKYRPELDGASGSMKYDYDWSLNDKP